MDTTTTRAHGRGFVIMAPLSFEEPYQLPPDLPRLIADDWRLPYSVQGRVHVEISSRWWRPMGHFASGYQLTDQALDCPPPQLPQHAGIHLVLEGLTRELGVSGHPVLKRADQITTLTWSGSRWAMGCHIKPTPGQLLIEISRPHGWTPPRPRASAAMLRTAALTSPSLASISAA